MADEKSKDAAKPAAAARPGQGGGVVESTDPLRQGKQPAPSADTPPAERSKGRVRLRQVTHDEEGYELKPVTAVTVYRNDRAEVVQIPNSTVVEVDLDVAVKALATGAFIEDEGNFAKVKKPKTN